MLVYFSINSQLELSIPLLMRKIQKICKNEHFLLSVARNIPSMEVHSNQVHTEKNVPTCTHKHT